MYLFYENIKKNSDAMTLNRRSLFVASALFSDFANPNRVFKNGFRILIFKNSNTRVEFRVFKNVTKLAILDSKIAKFVIFAISLRKWGVLPMYIGLKM